MKNLIKVILIPILILICQFSYGQNNMEDVVYLKNGSIIRGIIIEQVPNQSIKIQTKDRNVFFYKLDEIEKMTKENLPIENTQVQKEKKSFKLVEFKKSGYINITEGYYCLPLVSAQGYEYFRGTSYGIRTVNGYQFNEQFALGIGIGIEKGTNFLNYDRNYAYPGNVRFIPLTLDIRTSLLKGRVSPTFNFNGGYVIGLSDMKNGYHASTNLGIKVFITNNIAYLFNLGIKAQTQEIRTWGGTAVGWKSEDRFFGFLSINTGISF